MGIVKGFTRFNNFRQFTAKTLAVGTSELSHLPVFPHKSHLAICFRQTVSGGGLAQSGGLDCKPGSARNLSYEFRRRGCRPRWCASGLCSNQGCLRGRLTATEANGVPFVRMGQIEFRSDSFRRRGSAVARPDAERDILGFTGRPEAQER